MSLLDTDGFEGASIGRRLLELRDRVRDELPQVGRLSATLYDPSLNALRIVSCSTSGPSSFTHEETRLEDFSSLGRLTTSRRPETVTDADGSSRYRAPFYEQDRLRGFLTFESADGAFAPDAMRRLDGLAELTVEVLRRSLERVFVFRSTLRLMTSLARFRDAETGDHLQRVSHYARLIARRVGGAADLAEDLPELIYLFTSAHDIAKIAIPDSILCKPGTLTPAERAVMQKHVTLGLAMVDKIVMDAALSDMPHLPMLRNIVLFHHERLNGSGYPHGLAGEAIPLEARIVGVADVYDALRSPRPYKEPWSEDRTLEYLRGRRGLDFDPACVDALLSQSSALEAIAAQVADEPA